MFSKPIRSTRMESLEELTKFSYRVYEQKAEPKTYDYNNGQYAYADEFGCVCVTPYRPEVNGILTAAGYRSAGIFVPFSNGEKRPEAYRWLAKIANEENWAVTFEEAHRIAESKGIQAVDMKGITIRQIRDITEQGLDDRDNCCFFSGMLMQSLCNSTGENIGTYIIMGNNSVMLCDDYGRTFIITVKGTVNDLVNRLIESGYKRTANPERYIQQYAEPLPEVFSV